MTAPQRHTRATNHKPLEHVRSTFFKPQRLLQAAKAAAVQLCAVRMASGARRFVIAVWLG